MGATIRSKAIYTGRNYDVGAFRDDHYIRCSRCGWINNMDQAIHSNDGGYEGWGTTFTAVTSTSGGSGFGPNSPYNAGLQTRGPSGQLMYSSALAATDILVNSYGTFSFGFTKTNAGNQILLNGVSTGSYAVMLLLFNSAMYYVDNSSKWCTYTGTWVTTPVDPRTVPTLKGIETIQTSLLPLGLCCETEVVFTGTAMDAVVGAGCFQCGTLLYTR